MPVMNEVHPPESLIWTIVRHSVMIPSLLLCIDEAARPQYCAYSAGNVSVTKRSLRWMAREKRRGTAIDYNELHWIVQLDGAQISVLATVQSYVIQSTRINSYFLHRRATAGECRAG